MQSLEEVRQKLSDYNQSHLLQFWDQLTADQQGAFLKQLSTIDFQKVNNIFNTAQTYLTENNKKLDTCLKPVPPDQFESERGVSKETLENYQATGLEEIANNHVAVVLLAGGQGTRLGVSYPKGMYPLGLPSGKTLFQIQAERIRTLTRLAKEKTGRTGRIRWYIMTSEATHNATEKYLKEKNYFGLNDEDVLLFQQGLLPCFTLEGKIILEQKDSIALAPDGNGGIYLALEKNNIIEDMSNRGVKYIHVHSVDNILVKVADPVFIGYCVSKGADCGAKVIKKGSPTEPVGVVCQVDGHFQVVEYSEITESTANLRDAKGNLIFSAGSICNHFFTTDFLKTVCEHHERGLKLHVAKKKIPYVDGNGDKVTPTEPNGIKIEKFIFDVFPFSRNFVTWEVPRHIEFSPLKNFEGVKKDCPSTARGDLLRLHKLYIEKAGGNVTCDEVEISPLLSYAGEKLEEKVQGQVFDTRTVIYSDEEIVSNGVCGGETANLGQFPWMALLGYKQQMVDVIEYLCGGTVITERYILTAAHCLAIGVNHQLVSVRLGEHDLRSTKDCTNRNGVMVCADDPVDVPIESYVVHSQYDNLSLKNDIAVIKVEKTISFTDFIQPICLPFERNLDIRDLTNQKFTISGWGKTESRKLGGSPVLQFAMVNVWKHSACNNVIPPEVKPISENQLCANGKKEDACKGDSGGPLSNATLDLDGELRNFQIGIVSFASTLTCGVEELPPIYTRVDKYLEWITDNIK